MKQVSHLFIRFFSRTRRYLFVNGSPMSSPSTEKPSSTSGGYVAGSIVVLVAVGAAIYYGSDDGTVLSWVRKELSVALSAVSDHCGKGAATSESDDPFVGWPPSPSCVVSILPWILAILALGLGVALVSIVVMEQETDGGQHQADQREAQKQQSERRHESMREMMEELEERFEGWNDDELGSITFRMFFTALDELVEIPFHDPQVAKDGCQWAFKIFERELRIAADKTGAGEDLEYSDGKKLEELLDETWEFVRLARRAGFEFLAAHCWPHAF